jgi:hypothetical protein
VGGDNIGFGRFCGFLRKARQAQQQTQQGKKVAHKKLFSLWGCQKSGIHQWADNRPDIFRHWDVTRCVSP